MKKPWSEGAIERIWTALSALDIERDVKGYGEGPAGQRGLAEFLLELVPDDGDRRTIAQRLNDGQIAERMFRGSDEPSRVDHVTT